MKLSTVLLSLVSITSAASWTEQFRLGSNTVQDDALKVPGDNPLFHCAAPTDNDILQIESVDLSPNPPLPYV